MLPSCRRYILILITALTLCVFREEVYAEADFSDYFSVRYGVSETGQAKVTYNISIVNNTENSYVSDYTLSVNSTLIKEVEAEDRIGPLKVDLLVKEGKTEIRVTFNDKVVGAKRALKWNLSYLIEDLAVKKGSVWEITIPRLSGQPEIVSYDIEFVVPNSFGNEIYISPQPEKKYADDTYRYYSYGKKTFENTGVMASYGNKQYYYLELEYNLKNPNILGSSVEIALPPDISSQQNVILELLNPAPEGLKVDMDGNYLAKYYLKPLGNLKVSLKEKFIVNHLSVDLSKSGKISETPHNLREAYTKRLKYWETEDIEIQALAKSLINEELSAAENAKKIYNYVVSTLNYDWVESRKAGLTRKGARLALRNKTGAVCMEFADLLIALYRAAGIPARRLSGYAATNNLDYKPVPKNELHTWVSAYIAKIGWISIDPTWGATTNGLDFFSNSDTNHLVFAINGNDSELPYPAGTYRTSLNEKNDLKISYFDPSNFVWPELKLDASYRDGGIYLKNVSPVTALESILLYQVGDYPSKRYLGAIPSYSEVFSKIEPRGVTQNLKVEVLYKNIEGSILNKVFELVNSGVAPKDKAIAYASNPNIISFLSVLALCVTLFLLIRFRGFLQKLFSRRPFRRQDLNR